MEMEEFISDENTPNYAILSHRWGEEEVSLAHWETLPPEVLTRMNGYRKIQFTCEQAQRDGFDYAWVDT